MEMMIRKSVHYNEEKKSKFVDIAHGVYYSMGQTINCPQGSHTFNITLTPDLEAEPSVHYQLEIDREKAIEFAKYIIEETSK